MDKNKNIQLLEQFFNGTTTKQEVKQLLEELKNDEFEKEWMKDQWDQAPEMMNKAVQKQIMANIKADIVPTRTFKMKQWLALAASLLLVLTTSLSGYLLYEGQNKKLAGDMTVTVEKGQKVALTLPDKSRVWVNSGSTLTYGSRFNKHERIIALNGEAYFEVAKNVQKPFLISTGDIKIEVLGTKFNVSAYSSDNQSETVLLEGSVNIWDNTKLFKDKISMIPNQKATYSKTAKEIVLEEEVDPGIYAAWTDGWYQFKNESLEKVFLKLEKYYNIRFKYDQKIISGSLPISGKLDLKDSLEEVMAVLSKVAKFKYQISDNSVIIIK